MHHFNHLQLQRAGFVLKKLTKQHKVGVMPALHSMIEGLIMHWNPFACSLRLLNVHSHIYCLCKWNLLLSPFYEVGSQSCQHRLHWNNLFVCYCLKNSRLLPLAELPSGCKPSGARKMLILFPFEYNLCHAHCECFYNPNVHLLCENGVLVFLFFTCFPHHYELGALIMVIQPPTSSSAKASF